MDGEGVNLVVFAVGPVGLHHEAPAGELAQHPGLAVFGVQDQHLGLVCDVYSFKPAPFFRILRFWRRLHWICSPNALTGSMSTGTSFMFASADFNSGGMDSYFL